MKIIVDHPPLIDQIDGVFHCRDKEIIYAWGDIIYNPQNIRIPDFLIEHEGVHGKRQGTDIEGWWKRYMEDIEFRYQEELFAHVKEYQVRSQGVKDRNLKSKLLMWSAARLAAPLYGKMTNLSQATKDIRFYEKREV